jgi:SAM-dependent methyltransferase
MCAKCQKKYPTKNNSIFFRKAELGDRLSSQVLSKAEHDYTTLRLKAWVKTNPIFFNILYHLSATFIGRSAKEVISSLPGQSIILNIGSGVKKVGKDVINLDYDQFIGTQIVGDVYDLPFKDNSVDAVICESVLEHLIYPQEAVTEIRRVLKSEGLLYVVTPFMLGYHASPGDYFRWTEFGMKELLNGFQIKESGSAWGPTTALVSILGRWLSLVLSFGSRQLYQLWQVAFIFILAPLTLLDYLIGRHPMAPDNAHGLYFITYKK